jgi:NADPH-dependent 2,4-dienoyl-CoA reductase/sulfur reductase-like enzyme/rhodanese-related sulfurtransferase
MASKRVLIIGGVAGGASCAARLRRLDEHCEIVIYEMGSYVSFANCGLPYFIGDVIVEENKLMVATPELFRNRFNIQVFTDSQVLAIDRTSQTLTIKNQLTEQTHTDCYDALVIATGAQAVWPDIPGVDLPSVYALRTIPDSRKIRADLEKMRHAIVMGGGYLGLELAENLKKRGLEVCVLQSSGQLMPTLDKEMARYIEQHLRENGLECRLNAIASAIELNPDQSLTVQLQDGQTIRTDAVMISVGVKPRIELAQQAGLEIGELGGIRVNENMQTSDPKIWAVGDVVEVRNTVSGQWQLFPLAGPANRQGRLAAAHIADNGRQIYAAATPYRGVQGTSVCGLFGLTVAATGLTEKQLKQMGMTDYEKVYLHPGNHVGYYPGAKPIRMKLLYHCRDGRVLGAQAVGEAGVARRIDVIATFIQMQGTVFDLEEAELCYAPQFGATKDPVNLAGMIAANQLRGDHPLARWEELMDSHVQVVDSQTEQDEAERLLALILDDPFQQAQLIDVRTEAEFERKHIPGAINIPLDSLRQRLDELSTEREVWVVCGVGLRAYNATRILQQHGFLVKNLSGGMQTYDVFEESAS